MISKLKNFLLNFEALASLLLRFGIGIAFIIHGYAKFPLPPAGLVEYFGLPPALATFVAKSHRRSAYKICGTCNCNTHDKYIYNCSPRLVYYPKIIY